MPGKTKLFSSLVMVTLLLSLWFGVATGTASAHTATSHPTIVSSGQIANATAKQHSYWTKAKMMSARPADSLAASAKVTPKVPAPSSSSGIGRPVAPKAAKQAAKQVSPFASSNAAIIPAAFQLPNFDYSSYPYSTIGKVFFTDPQTGINYVCSGASVNSANLNVVDTAGHCIVGGGSGGDWYTNWVFCPQYYYGSTPFGCWSARYMVTSSDWLNSGSLEDDFGDVAVWPNSYGNLVDVVGGAGWAYGQAANQYFYPFGYPAGSPFDGNSIYYCNGTGTSFGFDDGSVVSVTCDMTGGSSGGPWLISLNGSFGYINGHNDFKYTNDNSHMYSPYYDSDWYNVFNTAQNA